MTNTEEKNASADAPLFHVGQEVFTISSEGVQKNTLTGCLQVNYAWYYTFKNLASVEALADAFNGVFIPEKKIFASKEELIKSL
jgi:hypothetical protein